MNLLKHIALAIAVHATLLVVAGDADPRLVVVEDATPFRTHTTAARTRLMQQDRMLRLEFQLPASGEYTIRVYQMGHAKSSGQRSSFRLDVAVAGGATKAATSPSVADDDKLVEASARASERKFNATGKIPCAQHKGQPMGQCDFGVARAGGGTAAVAITRPDGRTRVVFFKAGKAIAADLSQADGDMSFSATKEADLYLIRAGAERYEIPEAAIYGG